jgi:NitT/TauT family transport system ATP-binding protein
MPTDAPLIAARDAEMTFPGRNAALCGINLEVPAGEFVCLVGPSGCGKSTLLRLVAGLLAPSGGKVSVGGLPAHRPGRDGRRVGFVFQEPALLPWRNGVENAALPLELEGAPKQDARRRVEQCLELVGLRREDWSKRPRALSGGMRMRVSLARALAQTPDVLLLDEPFAALDDILRQQLNEELLRLWRLQGWTALFVTHNVAEAVFLGGRVLVMSPAPGRLVEEFRVPFAHPREPRLRAEPEFARLTGEVSRALRSGR